MKYLILLLLVVSCATPYNYENFRAAKPRSILILPPMSNSTDVRATYSYLSTVTMPVAEKGFYVFPVAIIDQMMKENGLPSANEMHQASVKKLREIINPDAILYLTLESYGTSYVIIDSQTTVTVSGKMISALTGDIIWEGRASANDGSDNSGGGLTGMLIGAVIKQAVNSSTDQAHNIAPQANQILFQNENSGLLNGPYHPKPQY
ncbi:MAG: GNA1162 family protein [Bdellovibrionota bacterium]